MSLNPFSILVRNITKSYILIKKMEDFLNNLEKQKYNYSILDTGNKMGTYQRFLRIFNIKSAHIYNCDFE